MTPLLSIENLCVNFASDDGASIAAVRAASFVVAPAQCLGIVGESGSGKTQLFMAAMGLSAPGAVVQGSVRFNGLEILGRSRDELNRVRGSKLTMIFQDPMSALTPHLKIGVQLSEVLVSHAGSSWHAAEQAALEALKRVRIPEPERRLQQYPHELSGGMRQRVMIAMSTLCDPELVIADEPTTSLDVTVQAQIIELFRELRRASRMALVLISHDMGVVAGLADRILVMYAGRVVESGGRSEVLTRPLHPYTAELLKCAVSLRRPRPDRMVTLPGQPPGAADTGPGCSFAPRCPRVAPQCRVVRPELPGGDGHSDGVAAGSGTGAAHRAACHFPLWP